MTSSHLGHHPRASALGAVTVDGLCLPHVKIECSELQSMAERNPYMSLNISFHLKKSFDLRLLFASFLMQDLELYYLIMIEKKIEIIDRCLFLIYVG